MYNGSFLYPRFKPDDGDDGTPILYIIWWHYDFRYLKGTVHSYNIRAKNRSQKQIGMNRNLRQVTQK